MTPDPTHIQSLLGDAWSPEFEYKIIFPSTFPEKSRVGWKLVLTNAGELLGETFLLVARPRVAEK